MQGWPRRYLQDEEKGIRICSMEHTYIIIMLNIYRAPAYILRAHILGRYCIHTAYILHTYCVHTAYILRTYCIHTAYILHTYCVLTAYILHTYCVHTAYYIAHT